MYTFATVEWAGLLVHLPSPTEFPLDNVSQFIFFPFRDKHLMYLNYLSKVFKSTYTLIT
jgi:hypothetical protein